MIFLFTDGEELGVVGATAFMREHPWAQDVGLSIVLEGLGTQGSSFLYTTGPNQGGVVREALDAMAQPGAFAYHQRRDVEAGRQLRIGPGRVCGRREAGAGVCAPLARRLAVVSQRRRQRAGA